MRGCVASDDFIQQVYKTNKEKNTSSYGLSNSSIRTCSQNTRYEIYCRGVIYIAAYLRTCSIFDPFKVDQHIIQSNNQSVMELMDHHQNSPELIRWNKTMEFGASHMYLSAERKLVTSNFDLI